MAAMISLWLAERSRTACAPALNTRTVSSPSALSSRTTKAIRSCLARYWAKSSCVGTSARRTSTRSRVTSSRREDDWSTIPTMTTAGSSRGSCSRLRRKTGSVEKIATATMKAGLLQSRPQLRHGSLADDNPQRSRRTTAYQCEINGIPDALRSEQPHDFAHPLDRLPIPGGDDITDENSRARGRSIPVDAHDENTAPAARRLRPIGCAFLLHGLEPGAEITAKDVSSRQQLIDGAVDS